MWLDYCANVSSSLAHLNYIICVHSSWGSIYYMVQVSEWLEHFFKPHLQLLVVCIRSTPKELA